MKKYVLPLAVVFLIGCSLRSPQPTALTLEDIPIFTVEDMPITWGCSLEEQQVRKQFATYLFQEFESRRRMPRNCWAEKYGKHTWFLYSGDTCNITPYLGGDEYIMFPDNTIVERDWKSLNRVFQLEYSLGLDEEERNQLMREFIELHFNRYSELVYISSISDIPRYSNIPSGLSEKIKPSSKTLRDELIVDIFTYDAARSGVVSKYQFYFTETEFSKYRFKRVAYTALAKYVGKYIKFE